MKTREEILELYTGSDYYKLAEFLPYVVDAMQEYFTQQTEAKEKEIELLRQSLADMTAKRIFDNEEAKELLRQTVVYIDHSDTRAAEKLSDTICNYINK